MKPQLSLTFAGRDDNEQLDLPSWYNKARAAMAASGETQRAGSLLDMSRQLPDVSKMPAGFYDEDASAWKEADRVIALVNPEWLDGNAPTSGPFGGASPIWHIPTKEYGTVRPRDLFGPLVALLRQDEFAEVLGDEGVFGEARCYRNGGEAHADIFFGGVRVGLPSGARTGANTPTNPFVFGLQVGYDYYGGKSVYAEVIAFDRRTGAVLRGLSNRQKRRHVGGAAEDIADWWARLLHAFDAMRNALTQALSDAIDYRIPLDTVPGLTAKGFYGALGLPGYLAEAAADRLPSNVQTGETAVTAWDAYITLANTMTEEFEVKTGGSAMRRHTNSATELLFAPARAETNAWNEIESDIKTRANAFVDAEAYAKAGEQPVDGQTTIDAALDELDERRTSVTQAAQSHTDVRERLTRVFEDAKEVAEAAENNDDNGNGGQATAATDGGKTK